MNPNHIRAIGFDLFNTLITTDSGTLHDANKRLMASLRQSGFVIEDGLFKKAHLEAALRFLEECRQDGRETHNRFWISAALQEQGYSVPPDDARIAEAVDAYFSAFFESCHLIPGTLEMLETLKSAFRLGLLSNFTHAPAAKKIIERLGLSPHFDVVLISGELGYRKPHPLVFRRLVEDLNVAEDQILYVGDDPEPDIQGALRAGLQPVWTTYVRDHNISYGPGILSRGSETPNSDVPRISSWGDLLSLVSLP
jgi:HAD superfamily hydrolase (TIGR01549 family)